jgi:PHD/YefM family antitoxin component YafN of YafNO toxin-antitoxin module
VIVESYGKPKAVVMSISAYEEVQAMREQRRRAQAFNELRALRAEVQAQNRGLTQKEADEIANRFSREMFDDMAARGDIVFERDLR